jgi:hypothetical protein
VPAFDAPGPYLACEVHGRLVHRSQPYSTCESEDVWLCVGFDGEAAAWCTAGPVPYASRLRLLAGEAYWPGVIVLDSSQDSDRLVPTTHRRAGTR